MCCEQLVYIYLNSAWSTCNICPLKAYKITQLTNEHTSTTLTGILRAPIKPIAVLLESLSGGISIVTLRLLSPLTMLW